MGTLSYVWGKLYRRAFLEEKQLEFSEFQYGEDKLFNMQCYCAGARYGLLRTWDMFIEGMRRLFPIVMIRIAESAGWELPGHLRNG